MAPVVLRDVTVYEKKHQVGEGTYGSVFVAQDKVSNEIVALKRINTKQEENGFPITAIREVKILKALNHPNVVTLKEIVTSKGGFLCVVFTDLQPQQQFHHQGECMFRARLAYFTTRFDVQFFSPIRNAGLLSRIVACFECTLCIKLLQHFSSRICF